MGRIVMVTLLVFFVMALSVTSVLAMGGHHHRGGGGGGGGGCGVPEIDPSLAPSALALLSGGLLILRSKIKRK